MTPTTGAERGGALGLAQEWAVDQADGSVHGITFDGRRLVLASGKRLSRLSPSTGRVIDQLETFPERGGLAYDGHYLWQCSEGGLQQLNPRTGFVWRSLSLAVADITGLECLGGDLLVLHAAGHELARVETLNATMIANVEVETPLHGLAWIAHELWTCSAGTLCRIDSASACVIAQWPLPAGIEVCDLAGDTSGRLWCVDGRSRHVRALASPRSASVA